MTGDAKIERDLRKMKAPGRLHPKVVMLIESSGHVLTSKQMIPVSSPPVSRMAIELFREVDIVSDRFECHSFGETASPEKKP
jgi:hypothetical protein